MTYAHPFDLTEFAPQKVNSYIAGQYQSAIWQGLYTRDLHIKAMAPLLATSMPQWSDKNTVATIDIKSNVTFADGHVMDMEDVVESFKRVLNASADDIRYPTFLNYFGKPEDRGGWDNIIKVIDTDTVQFNLTQPYFLANSLFTYPILPTHTWGTHDNPTATDYKFNTALSADPGGNYGFGTGPFRYLTISEANGEVVLEKNENYWNGSTFLDTLSFSNYTATAALADLEKGDAHIIDPSFNISPSIRHNLPSGITYKTAYDYSWQEIALDMHHPIFGTGSQTPLGVEDPSRAAEAARYIRQAMSHAIPRQAIIDEIVDGLALPGMTAWANGTQHFNPNFEPYEYNITRSKELLGMAGYASSVDPEDSSDIIPNFGVGPSFLELIILNIIITTAYYKTRGYNQRRSNK